ncbi:helix-turn-helix transcriptional regulator [Dactylosporangium sp. NPDC049140]|jgi:AraC-like DNA-binding protein|uniref:AraC family transcriptional regulator n=1 Tax=Dactylosporangium sp. NPDC049140 TaxID=3155647 RepID=UPI0033C7978D
MEIHTRDRDVIADALHHIVTHRARITFGDPADVDLSMRAREHGELSGVRLRLGGVGYAAASEPVGYLLAAVVEGGEIAVRVRGRDFTLGPDDGMLFPMGHPFLGEYGRSTMGAVGLPLAYVAGLAEAESGPPAADLRFEGALPVSEAMRRHWAATGMFLSRQLTAPGVDLPPLIAGQLRRLGALSLLSVFPNTTMTAARTPADGRVAPAVVRRAVEFMQTNPDRPLTVADIAAEAGVGSRGLQVALRRRLGLTPMEHLRRVRLGRVHRDLRAAFPGGGVTVRETARRRGFANPGRFAADYRAVYGRPPSRTLRV